MAPNESTTFILNHVLEVHEPFLLKEWLLHGKSPVTLDQTSTPGSDVHECPVNNRYPRLLLFLSALLRLCRIPLLAENNFNQARGLKICQSFNL
jgi:hypothetical protein